MTRPLAWFSLCLTAIVLVVSMTVSAAPITSGRTLDIAIPRAYAPFLKPSRYKGAHGGRGSAKSHIFAEMLLAKCVAEPGTRVVCVREVQRSLEQSVKRLLTDKIEKFEAQHLFHVSNTQIATPGGGVIIFNGMQDHTADSIKSLEGFNVAWVEEAQNLSARSLTLLRPTIREPNSEIWMTWNPRFATDPVDQLLRGANKLPDAIVVGTTFRDNPWFPDVLRMEMEWDQRHDTDKYAHVWLGDYETHSERRVFKNWRIDEFETPADAVFLFGGDWGYSIDPAVLVRGYLVGKTLYIDQEAYKIGVEIDDLPNHFNRIPNAAEWPIIVDSSRPDTISYMKRHGFPRMEASIKGKDSIKEGVIFLQGYEIVVHPRCVHTIDELTHYSFAVDKLTGQVLPKLEDKKNHVIDSLRYATERLRRATTQEYFTW